ncbi:MAG TPA: hypothetical protein VGG83_11325 [Trebonia sp.]
MSAGRHALPRVTRAREPRWYRLPMPLAVLVVVAMPWVAVRDARQSHSAFRTLCDVVLMQDRQLQQYEPRAKPRHLYAVK